MTEQPLLQPPDEVQEPLVRTPKNPQRDLIPWLYGIGFLVLAVAIFYIWQYPSTSVETASDGSAIQKVEQQQSDIESRIKQLEQRSAPDLTKIVARLDALDGQVADSAQFSSRLDTLTSQIKSMASRDQVGLDAASHRIDLLTSRMTAFESNAGSLGAISKRLNRIAKLQEASIALAAGRPIGDFPEAPEALARFAHATPPTEAQLRLRFSHDEQAALKVEQPSDGALPFIDRVWDRAQGLITIRRGDDIVVGNAAATILSHALVALDAGDIAGAVDAVDALKGQPAQAMASWLTDAKALLAARSALAEMADQT